MTRQWAYTYTDGFKRLAKLTVSSYFYVQPSNSSAFWIPQEAGCLDGVQVWIKLKIHQQYCYSLIRVGIEACYQIRVLADEDLMQKEKRF